MCCELLSKCIFGISFTIDLVGKGRFGQLWIAFKMYLWHIVYNTLSYFESIWLVVNCFQNVSLAYRLQSLRLTPCSSCVVNCFQNVSLAYRLQSKSTRVVQTPCCELLSKCIFGISFTIFWQGKRRAFWLWIAFKMYLWHIVYNQLKCWL